MPNYPFLCCGFFLGNENDTFIKQSKKAQTISQPKMPWTQCEYDTQNLNSKQNDISHCTEMASFNGNHANRSIAINDMRCFSRVRLNTIKILEM